LNAKAFEAKGYSRVLLEENMDGNKLVRELEALLENAEKYRQSMRFSPFRNGAEKVMDEIRKFG